MQLNDGSILLYTQTDIMQLKRNFFLKKLKSYKYGNITNVKKLKNGKILVCNGDLYIYSLKSKKMDSKTLKMPNFNKKEILFDIAELQNGEIIGISTQSILKIKIKDNKEEKDEISEIYEIPKEWFRRRRKRTINQYFNIFALIKNKLLIHFIYFFIVCGMNGSSGNYSEINDNEIFVFDLDKFKIIHTFREFQDETYILILKNIFALQNLEKYMFMI